MRSSLRDTARGFTLLETLIAFAIGSMAILAAFGVIAQASARQARTQSQFDLARFAGATLSEYIVTYPVLSASGTYADRWRWRIDETQLSQPDLQAVGLFVDYVRVNITVSDLRDTNGTPLQMSTAIVRKAAAR